MERKLLAALIAAALLPLAGPKAGAAEIQILSPMAVRAGMQTLAAGFTKETGTVVDFTFANAGTIPAMLHGDAPADLIVLPFESMEAVDK